MSALLRIAAAAFLTAFGFGMAVSAAELEVRYQFVEGDPNAKVEVIEYASLTCPHCGHFHRDVYPDIKKNYVDTGKVRWVFRHFPLDSLAMAGSLLTACAPNDNGRKLYDALFKNQDAWVLSQSPIEPLKGYAQLAGMTGDDVDNCLRNKTLIEEFRGELQKISDTQNIEATPAFFIGDEDFQGGPSYPEFAEILEKHLAAAAPKK